MVTSAPIAAAQEANFEGYASPHQLVAISNGRKIHLHCEGAGSPTVVLTAGLGGWSATWNKVQPAIAKRTRVCAWDRAGYGFSDGSPDPQTAAHTTADLEAALKAAKIPGPYVMVSHSAGSYETLLFTDRHRKDVVGLVLVDPSIPDQVDRFSGIAPGYEVYSEADTRETIATYQACADQLVHKGAPDGPDAKKCFPPNSSYPIALNEALAKVDQDPKRLLTKRSLQEEFPTSAKLVMNAARNYGDLPLVVLTAGKLELGPDAPSAARADLPALNAAWRKAHDEYAALSTRGVNRIVEGSGHGIQQQKPEAVIAAINEVLDQAAGGAP